MLSDDGSVLVADYTPRGWREYTGPMVVWDVRRAKKLITLDPPGTAFVGAIASGAMLYAASVGPTYSGMLRIWSLNTGRVVEDVQLAIPARLVKFTIHSVWVALSTSGARLAYGSDLYNDIHIRDRRTGSTVAFRTSHPVRHHLFSPDGRLLATAAEAGSVCLWNSATGTLSATLCAGVSAGGEAGVLHSCAFSPDSARIAVGSYYLCEVYSTVTGERQLVLPTETLMMCGAVRFSACGRWLAASCLRGAGIFDTGVTGETCVTDVTGATDVMGTAVGACVNLFGPLAMHSGDERDRLAFSPDLTLMTTVPWSGSVRYMRLFGIHVLTLAAAAQRNGSLCLSPEVWLAVALRL